METLITKKQGSSKNIQNLTYSVWVLGCQQNYSDAERFMSVLESLGFKKAPENEASLVLVMACSVRQHAIDRILGKARQWNKIKRDRPLQIALSGCVLPSDKPKLQNAVDFIFENNEIEKLQNYLSKEYALKPITEFFCNGTQDLFKIDPQYQSHFQASVPISQGCDNFCSYCAVPITRGREHSRPMAEIINEVKSLVSRGYKEITLIGQNVNSYGNDFSTRNKRPFDSAQDRQKTRNNFVHLLEALNKIPDNFWLRFISNHPKDFSKELIKALPTLKKVTPYIHLPVQSGSDRILKAMNRHYSVNQYLKLLFALRSQLPALTLTTDIIVGFPGETEKDFQNTIDLFKKATFDMAYIAKYSPRPGTAAARLADDVPPQEKERRFRELTKVLAKIALENNQKIVGTIRTVLIEKVTKNGQLFGRTRAYKNITLSGDASMVGQFVKVKVTDCYAWGLSGKIISKL